MAPLNYASDKLLLIATYLLTLIRGQNLPEPEHSSFSFKNMKIAAAINGNMISEKTAEYALFHCSAMKGSLTLFFVQNGRDELNKVQASADRLQSLADKMEISCQFEISKNSVRNFVKQLVSEQKVDLIYCSTRAKKQYFEHSFSEQLVKLKPNCSLAVVKVVSMGSIANVDKVGVYARNQKLKTELFSLSAALSKSLDSKLFLTTNLKEKRQNLLNISSYQQQRKLNLIDQNLKPFLQLCKLIGIRSTIYHLYEDDVNEEHLAYVLSRNIDLLIFEAYSLPFIPLRLNNPAEALFKLIPINCVVYYPSN